MSANLSGNNIDNGDFMIKTCAADPEAGYAKEKFHADPKNGIIISEVDGAKGKRLEFSADWSVVSLETELKQGDNIKIGKDQVSGKVEISAPDVGKVKTDNEDTFGYLNDKISVAFPIIKKQISIDGVKSVVIESAEKIAFAPNEIRKADWEEYNWGFEKTSCVCADISRDSTSVNGVNFVSVNSSPLTIAIDFYNGSGSSQTLKLYAADFEGSWSDAAEFNVPLLIEGRVRVEVPITGVNNAPIGFLLAPDNDVSNIEIFNIYAIYGE